jgi:hypothetical protein
MCAEAEARGEVSYIVCATPYSAYGIANRAKEMGLTIGFPITFAEFREGQYYGQRVKNFYIDNADYLLQSMTIVPIRAIVLEKRENDE